VEGIDLKCQQFPARKALILGAKVIKVLSPAFTGGLSMDAEVDIKTLAPLLANLGSKDVQEIANELLQNVYATKEGKSIQLNTETNQDLVFEADLKAYIGAIAFALEVNFSPFLASLDAKPKPAMANASI
jgi:hypothetical protein